MKVLHETIALEPTDSFSCREFAGPFFDCPYHRHPEIEILRIDESQGRVLAGDYAGDFGPGEIYVFGSRFPHAFINQDGTQRARSHCLQFSPELITTTLGALPEFHAIPPTLDWAARGLLLAPDTAERVSDQLDALFVAEGIARLVAFLEILNTIAICTTSRELASNGYSLRNPDRQLARLESTISYIHENSSADLSVRQLAKAAGMSESAFHRLFRIRLGCTPGAFVLDVRLSTVAHQLLETENSISEIAFAAGFNNLSNFNRQFLQRFACTPRDYRRR